MTWSQAKQVFDHLYQLYIVWVHFVSQRKITQIWK